MEPGKKWVLKWDKGDEIVEKVHADVPCYTVEPNGNTEVLEVGKPGMSISRFEQIVGGLIDWDIGILGSGIWVLGRSRR